MSGFKKKLLAVFLVVAAAGGALRVPAYFTAGEQAKAEPAPQFDASAAESRGSSFTDDAVTLSDDDDNEPARAEPAGIGWKATIGGWMAKLGLSFAGGLIAGVFFRIYLKTMAALAAVATAGFVGLSYFEVINLDFTVMRENYDSATAWLSSQAGRVKDLLLAIFPSATAAGAGFFSGVLKK